MKAMNEFAIFACFYGVALASHTAHLRLTQRYHEFFHAHHFAFYVALAGAAAKEYAVHFLVYSGYVFGR